MLEFPEEFFQAEERNEFLIDETMKTVWAAELEVLQEIAVICNRHHLTWYAGYGTLLGAVRHGGFIPWDDDIDIIMKRPDYMKLLEVMEDELPEGFRVHCSLNERGFDSFQCMVDNSDSICIEPDFLNRFHGCPFSVGVDIFPLDYLPKDASKRDYQAKRFLLVRQTIWLIKFGEDTEENRKQIQSALSMLETLYGQKFQREDDFSTDYELLSRLWELGNRIAMECDEQDSDALAMYVNYAKWGRSFDKKWFDDVTYLPFEQVMLPVPKEYDVVLRADYGDYTVPVRNTTTHDYPIYKKQLEELRRIFQEKISRES